MAKKHDDRCTDCVKVTKLLAEHRNADADQLFEFLELWDRSSDDTRYRPGEAPVEYLKRRTW